MSAKNWYSEKLTAEDIKTEQWAYVPNYEGEYSISSLGRVISHKDTDYELTPQVNNYGAVRIQLHKNGYVSGILIGKTVAKLFVPNPKGYKYIRFKNGDSLDCRSCNIEWAKLTDKMKTQYKKANKKVNKYDLDGNYIQTFGSVTQATEGGLCMSMIGAACKLFGKYEGYQWRFAEDFPIGKNIGRYESKKRGILQIGKEKSEVIREYRDMEEVYSSFKTEKGKPDRANIYNTCIGKRQSAYGYKWVFAPEKEEK